MQMQMLADIFTFLIGLGVTWLVIIAVATLFWIWAFVDAVLNPRLNGTGKILWLVVVGLGHFVGATLYFLIGRGQPAGGAPGV